MAMEQEQFEALVKRLETYARAHPQRYKLRVALLAGLGYAYLLFVLVALLVAAGLLALAFRVAAFLAIKLAIPLLALIGAVLRAMWVTMPEPEGVLVKRSDAPQLFATLEEIGKRLRSPRPHTVLLTFDFNAGVTHRPRLGIFGWPKRYLILGYPLMQALTPEQFRAVIAHEFGHLSGNHGRFAGWIYRIRQTWNQLLQNLQQSRRWGSAIFIEFSQWYAPLFNAYSFVLARAHEYEADRAAAEVTSRQAMAESLIATEVRSRFLIKSFWPAFWKQTGEQREPPADAVATAGRQVTQSLPVERASEWMAEGFHRATTYFDTHPALVDRLTALGYAASSPEQSAVPGKFSFAEAVVETAAIRFLGTNAGRLVATLNAQWKKKVLPKWHDAFDHLRETRQTLATLEEKAQTQTLSPEETWRHAWCTLELKGHEAAAPLLQKIVAQTPEHVSANYWLGQILLGQGDAAGATYLEKAMACDPMIVAPGCRLLSAFYATRGQAAEAQSCLRRGTEQQKIIAKAERERATAVYSDPFEPHALSTAELAPLREILSWFDAVEHAYLVRKKVQFLPQKPFYVLGILRRRNWFERNPQRESQDLANMLAKRVRLGSGCRVVVFTARSNWKKSLLKIPGSEIYVGGEKARAPQLA
jgi:Zn-dependent protease with chaperone function